VFFSFSGDSIWVKEAGKIALPTISLLVASDSLSGSSFFFSVTWQFFFLY
jgi:hypothetical protein